MKQNNEYRVPERWEKANTGNANKVGLGIRLLAILAALGGAWYGYSQLSGHQTNQPAHSADSPTPEGSGR